MVLDRIVEILVLLVFFAIFLVGTYVYSSYTLMLVAEKLKGVKLWRAWVPIANIYLMADISKSKKWPVHTFVGGIIGSIIIAFFLLSDFAIFLPSFVLIFLGVLGLISFVAIILGSVYYYVFFYRICELRKYPGWYSLLTLVSIFGSIFSEIPLGFFIVLGIIVTVISGIWNFVLWGLLAWRDIK